MRGASKKMFISILTSVVVFVTMVATTFAWVGIFTYANTDSFQMNLKVNKSSSYFLTISSKDSTVNSDYGEEIPLNEIQKQVLKKYNIYFDDSSSNSYINAIYNDKIVIKPSTPIYNSDNNIDHFERLDNLARGNIVSVNSKYYIKFDVFFSVNTLEGIDNETTGINAEIVLDKIKETIEGQLNAYILENGNTIRKNIYTPSDFNWELYEAHKSLTSVVIDQDGNQDYKDKEVIQINSASSARFALEVYNPIKLTDTYTGAEKPINTIIYQGGSALPTYDEDSNVYSMGGILPEEYNFGVRELDTLFFRNLVIPDQTRNYENKVRTLEGSKKDNYVWNAPNFEDIDTTNINYLGVMNGIQTKQKVSVYLWNEGWDSDCTWAVDSKSITLNLTFTADIDE